MNNDIIQSVANLTVALESDPDYRIAWQANIAMAFIDECRWFKQGTAKKTLSRADIHLIANAAADKFLTLLCKESPICKCSHPRGRHCGCGKVCLGGCKCEQFELSSGV